MKSNQVPTNVAPKAGRTKAIAVATLIPVLAGTAVATSTPANAAPVTDSTTATTIAPTTTKKATPGPRAATTAISASQMRALKVKRTNVFVVGDSLTVGSKTSIHSSLKRKTRSIQINAQIGRYTPAGVSILKSGAAKRANVWVVALGTNDGPSAGTTKKNVRKVMKLAGKREVIWLTVVRPGKYERVNRALKQMDRQHSNLTVADWAQVVKKNKRLLSGDQVHLTASGYKIRGKYVANCVVQAAGK